MTPNDILVDQIAHGVALGIVTAALALVLVVLVAIGLSEFGRSRWRGRE
jgi:hypothetical protein